MLVWDVPTAVYIPHPRIPSSPNPPHPHHHPFPAPWGHISITPPPRVHTVLPHRAITHSIAPAFPPRFCNTIQVPVTLINEDLQFSWSIIHLLTFIRRQLKDALFPAWCFYSSCPQHFGVALNKYRSIFPLHQTYMKQVSVIRRSQLRHMERLSTFYRSTQGNTYSSENRVQELLAPARLQSNLSNLGTGGCTNLTLA